MLKRFVIYGGIAVIGLFVLAQFLPIGRIEANPPVVQEVAWDSAETRALAERACFDCHSNETAWPWYSKVAPTRWLLAMDVSKGRQQMNFSDWGNAHADMDEIAGMLQRGQMPPSRYLMMHGDAKLTAAERAQLVDGMVRTLGSAE
jgi:hypothetical protein